MDKTRMSPRHRTIMRLQAFLQDSVNIEPELEQFIKHLIMALQSYTYNGGTLDQQTLECAEELTSKIQH